VKFFNAPNHYPSLLGKLPDDLTFLEVTDREAADFVHAFAHNHAQLFSGIFTWKAMLKKTGMLWISWPNNSAKLETDLSDAVVRETGLAAAGLVDVNLCAVDEDWSALKFVYRLKERENTVLTSGENL